MIDSDSEIWRTVPDSDGLYEVSDWGRVRRAGSSSALSPWMADDGLLRVNLSINGRRWEHRVHRLVVATFFGTDQARLHYVWRDGDRTNNAVSNLVPRRQLCSRCDVELTPDNGYVARPGSVALRPLCRMCTGIRRRETHDRVETERRVKLGLDVDTCAICGQSETATRGGRLRRLTIDHDHVTGFIRGALCSACNTGLGMFKDSPATLRAAAAYLEGAARRSTEGAA